MVNIYECSYEDTDGLARARVGSAAGSERLGVSVYKLAPGQSMVFHYHVQREELLIVLEGTLALRNAEGWRDLPAGEVISFPRGPSGAHGYENRTTELVRLVVISEQNAPNISVYPDTEEIGVFDHADPEQRRFGARFRIEDAVSDYGGGHARLVDPQPPAKPEQTTRTEQV